jgi:adenine-specific DNA-methyltransferase
LANLVIELPCNCLNIRDFVGKNLEKRSKTELANVYKILSPEHLLKLSFKNDANQLNQGFYRELLHIIGLEEAKDDASNKKIIRRVKDLSQRNEGSLLENTLSELTEDDSFKHLLNPDSFGQSLDEQFFSVSLELCITWLNRILFLKLLESQLITYHKNDKNKQFLSPKLIQDYDLLNELFFAVLARSPEKRSASTNKHFGDIPYLNSSLFEQTDLEDKTLTINQLKNRLTIPYFAQTVLKDVSGKRSLTGEVPTLTYLLEFLNAYHFGSDDTGELIQDRPKDLISASVLGLIFEKLNGYKDGSFFTPSFITMYMCHQSIRRAVVEKMSVLVTGGYKDFEDLSERLDYADRDTRLKANQLINCLHICDPAVGSGHFLVSALNELIQIKYDLKILSYRHSGKRIDKDWKIEIDNDELRITDREEGNLFVYNPQNENSQFLQETLFHEKQTLIENCLFGVDINPKSVSICRLRLWIELLKNAYYVGGDGSKGGREKGGKNLDNNSSFPPNSLSPSLQTLPNIDINIKTGNSLVSRFGLDTDLSKALRSVKYNITQYRGFVEDYKNANNKELKQGLEKLIGDIKGNFRTEIVKYSNPKILAYQKLTEELYVRFDGNALFGSHLTDKQIVERDNLTEKINKLKAEIDDQQNARIYQNAFEWRFEFPEVLDDKGNFIGFDVVVGNPPYIRQEEIKEYKKQFQNTFKTYTASADIYVFFMEKGFEILKPQGQISYIIPNKWMQAGYGKPLRNSLLQKQILEIVDFGDLQVFDGATTYPCIIGLANNKPTTQFKNCTLKSLDFGGNFNNAVIAQTSDFETKNLTDETWILSSNEDQFILEKIKKSCVTLAEYVGGEAHYGIKTGLTEAFIIDENTKNDIIEEDGNSEEIIKSVLRGRDIKPYYSVSKDVWLIGTFPTLKLDIDNYPGVKNHLLNFGKDRLEQSGMPNARKKTSNKWFETQDNIGYWEEFEKPKIMYQKFQVKPCFIYDESGLYCNDSMWIISKDDKVLVGILNSKMGWWLTSKYCTAIQNGYQLIWNYFGQIPIPKANSEQSVAIIEKVDAILALKKGEVQSVAIKKADFQREEVLMKCLELEAEIDEMVFDLYGLTAEERGIVGGVSS